MAVEDTQNMQKSKKGNLEMNHESWYELQPPGYVPCASSGVEVVDPICPSYHSSLLQYSFKANNNRVHSLSTFIQYS